MSAAVGTAIHAQQSRMELNRLLSSINDIESSSRGFVLTGDPDYLQGYGSRRTDVQKHLRKIPDIGSNNPTIQISIRTLSPLIRQKLDHSSMLIQLRRNSGFEAARAEIVSGVGKKLTDSIREEIALLDSQQMRQIIAEGKADNRATTASRWIILSGSILSLTILIVSLAMLLRENRLRSIAEKLLHESNDSLEMRVRQRTLELATTNEALLESSERLRLSVEAAKIGLWDWNIETNQVNFSNDWRSNLGYEERELGNDMGDWENLVHPDDQARVRVDIQRYLAAGIGAHTSEFRLRHSDGSWRWINSRSEAVRDANGRPLRAFGCNIDITDQKRAETERTWLFDFSPDPHCIAGFDGFFKELNPAWTARLGWSVEELKAKPWLEFVHPDDREDTELAKTVLINDVPVMNFENRYMHKDGSYRLFSWQAVPLFNENRIIAVARDITEHRLVEQALQTSERAVRAFLDALPTPAMLVDSKGAFIALNEALAQSLRRTREELVGQVAYDLLPSDLSASRKAVVDSVFANGKETRIEDSNGEHHFINYFSPLRDAEGQVISVAIIALDITDRKRAEEKLELQLDELRRWHLATIDREDRALDLKHEINQLLEAAGQPVRYPSAELTTAEMQP